MLVLIVGTVGCGSSSAPPTDVADSGQSEEKTPTDPPVVNPRDLPPGRNQLMAPLKIYTNPTGCLVFIGTEVVRGEGETFAQTPLEVMVPRGRMSVSVERPGGQRVTRIVDVPVVEEVEFDVSSVSEEEGAAPEPSFLNAPYFEASVGRSLELKSLNTSDKEFDPFVAPDGLSIWFVSDRGGVRGVYKATRPSPYHDFDEPQIVEATSGADMPASPTVTADGRMLMYVVPEKARIWQTVRKKGSTEFGKKEIVRSDDDGSRAWRSAQLSSDGLRLYWTEEGGDEITTRAAVRTETSKLFGKTLKFDLPEHHPHLSQDGLRHFTFDGSKLHRARRGSIKQPFGAPEVIAELTLDNYTVSPRHRQFWVTEDEQWLFYSDDPRSGGDLFMVRLSDGPVWGRVLRGTPIENKVMVAKKEEDTPRTETPASDKPAEPAVDPLTLPLPYSRHWTALAKLITEGQADEALALAQKAVKDKALANDRTLVSWDVEMAEHVAEFYRDVTRAVEALKPGSLVRVGGTRFEFESREGDELHLKLKDKAVIKKVSEMSASDLVALADSGPEKADAAKALRIGIYLYFQGGASLKVSDQWLKRALAEGEIFHDRIAARNLIQGQQEIARGKFTDGIGFLDAAIEIAPNSDSGKQAVKEKGTLYDKLEWKPIGNRKWKQGELGEYLADATRSNGSYLMSGQQYGDFEVNCEWKVTGPTAMGGVYLRFDGRGNPFENGAKIHLANDLDQKGVDQYSTGSLFASDAPMSNASLPEGKWNTLRIRTRNKTVQVAINGKDVLKATLKDDVPSRGHVVLDGVAGGISYRKVLVFELPKGE